MNSPVDVLRPDRFCEREPGHQALDDRPVVGPESHEAAGLQRLVVPAGRRDHREVIVEAIFAYVQDAGAGRREQPLVRAACKIVAVHVLDAVWHLPGHVCAVDDGYDAALARGIADLPDRHEQPGRAHDAAETQYAGLRADCRDDRIDELPRIVRRHRQHDFARRQLALRLAHLPWFAAARVLLVGQQDLGAGLQHHAARDDRHRLGRIVRDCELVLAAAEEFGERRPFLVQGLVTPARVALDLQRTDIEFGRPVHVIGDSLQNRSRRDAEAARVEKSPLAGHQELFHAKPAPVRLGIPGQQRRVRQFAIACIDGGFGRQAEQRSRSRKARHGFAPVQHHLGHCNTPYFKNK